MGPGGCCDSKQASWENLQVDDGTSPSLHLLDPPVCTWSPIPPWRSRDAYCVWLLVVINHSLRQPPAVSISATPVLPHVLVFPRQGLLSMTATPCSVIRSGFGGVTRATWVLARRLHGSKSPHIASPLCSRFPPSRTSSRTCVSSWSTCRTQMH